METLHTLRLSPQRHGDTTKTKLILKFLWLLLAPLCLCGKNCFLGKKLKIALVTDTYFPRINGVSTSTQIFAEEFAKIGP